jgi:4-amino-4-deoxy-L-arabinose transferase-like glycosyltransferase
LQHRGVFRTGIHRVSRSAVALGLILIVQAALSLRLIWSNTAFPDEALYLWAGHLEWAHWLHGAPLPAFPTYFSGAPVVYPPVGALADSLGGLAGARILSLCFMLTATCLLHSLTRSLFGRRAALLAAGMFAATAATQFLGAFATYDSMALTLLAFAAWLAVKAAERGSAVAAFGIAGSCGAVLAVADAAKYAAALWNPVVVALVILLAWRARGLRAGVAAGALCAAVLAAAVAAALELAGHPYWRGITFTTLGRAHGSSSAAGIAADSLGWVGVAGVLAALGAVIMTVRSRDLPLRLTTWVLAGAIILAPANQARIHVFTSLFKHVGFGAWFAAAAAGYALASLADAVPAAKRHSALRAAGGAIAGAALLGAALAATHFGSWPDSAQFTAKLRTVLAGERGPVLAADNGNVIEYYLPGEAGGVVFYGPWFFDYRDPETGKHLVDAPGFADAVRHRYFSVVALSFSDSQPVDVEISADIRAYGGYRLVSVLPYRVAGWQSAFRIWVREGASK